MASVLGARLRVATEPVARVMFAATLDAIALGADHELAEAARIRAWASHLDELDAPDRIVERLEAELAALTPAEARH
jgi:hypothetical protein